MMLEIAQAGASTSGLGWPQYLLAFALIAVCFLLIVIILLQKGRGGGLSAALGGAGGNTAFGAKTGDVFTWITVAFATLFLLLAVTGNYVFRLEATAQTPSVGSAPASEIPLELPEPDGGPADTDVEPTEGQAPDDALPAGEDDSAGGAEDDAANSGDQAPDSESDAEADPADSQGNPE